MINNNYDKNVKYEWINSPFENELQSLPDWLYYMLCPLELKDKLTKKEEINEKELNILKETNNYEIIKLLTTCLSSNRANSEYTWMELGWCLFNIEDSMRYLELWKKFSKLSSKYKEGECDLEWALMRDSSSKYSKQQLLKEASLHYWAKSDNVLRYKEIM